MMPSGQFPLPGNLRRPLRAEEQPRVTDRDQERRDELGGPVGQLRAQCEKDVSHRHHPRGQHPAAHGRRAPLPPPEMRQQASQDRADDDVGQIGDGLLAHPAAEDALRRLIGKAYFHSAN
jgi:hypothetical protein